MATKAAHNTELLKAALRLSDDDYQRLVFEEGCAYLDLYMADDASSRMVLLELPEYWSWWMRAFDQRNAQFIAEQHLEQWAPMIGKWERALLRSLFNEMHSAELLEVKPARNVMRTAMRVMRERMRS